MLQATVTLMGLSLAIGLPLHLAAARLLPPRRQLHGIIAAGAIAMLVAVAVAGRIPLGAAASRWGLLLFAEIVLLSLLVPAIAFYSAVDHSIRPRICVDFLKSGEPSMTHADLLRRYDASRAFRWRFSQLVDSGYIQALESRRYRPTPKGRLFAWLGSTLRSIYGQKSKAHP